MPEEDLVELNFRLYDGSDIGPIRYAASSTVAMLKERIISEWPRDKKIIPRVATDVKLICGGKMLENNKTVAQCRSPFDEISGGFITMHVVVQPSSSKVKTSLLIGRTACGPNIISAKSIGHTNMNLPKLKKYPVFIFSEKETSGSFFGPSGLVCFLLLCILFVKLPCQY
ncbi:membrane-anchored ubiquitin-fold protein 4-like isoform X1 [Zingiber officinale]|uniref:membrane-anchored ubiquitin-fold protein 4-like isoform X1 n=1 Tax=Zingiber officinale TaxID=94328 RepID=UPI001C4DCA8E|nr:membrane-anchored ubiquitin-fold protein 4-like isoform X1 [Zingiber officinale]